MTTQNAQKGACSAPQGAEAPGKAIGDLAPLWVARDEWHQPVRGEIRAADARQAAETFGKELALEKETCYDGDEIDLEVALADQPTTWHQFRVTVSVRFSVSAEEMVDDE